MIRMGKKFGFFRKTKSSNKKLIAIFEENQALRYGASDKDWQNKDFQKKIIQQESRAKKEALLALKAGKIKTPDDFYRASWFFHHSENYKDNALAVALAAASWLNGELWGKNFFAVTVDRFLLAIKQPQYFVTQYEKTKGRWVISRYNPKVKDSVRKRFDVGTLKSMQDLIVKLNFGK